MNSILLTGSGGLVGNRILRLLQPIYNVVAPNQSQLDITNVHAVSGFVRKYSPDVIINAAAFSDVSAAELERDNKDGLCWKVNAVGTKNLVRAAGTVKAFVILLSTGSVFSGTADNPGPFKETDGVSPKRRLGWYAYTKVVAERAGADAIVRLSHVIGPGGHSAPNGKVDYLQSILQREREGSLYPLFTDQEFPVTYTDDIAEAIIRIGEKRKRGLFHVVSADRTSPYEMVKFFLNRNDLQTISYREFIKHVRLPLRYSQYHAIDGAVTRRVLKIPSRTWRQVLALV